MRPVHVLSLLLCAATALSAQPRLTVTSAELSGKTQIPEAHVFSGFGCSGANESPSLQWSNVPAGTRSIAVTMYDPDAPTGSGWWHWVVYNLPPSMKGLAAGVGSGKGLPAGAVQGRTDFGSAGYGGPCPPAGDKPHRYVFTLFALKVEKLELPLDATAAMVGFNLNANVIQKAEFTAMYRR
jgi:Raf kinase inhibitor-like YbhB/YbcL family protein